MALENITSIGKEKDLAHYTRSDFVLNNQVDKEILIINSRIKTAVNSRNYAALDLLTVDGYPIRGYIWDIDNDLDMQGVIVNLQRVVARIRAVVTSFEGVFTLKIIDVTVAPEKTILEYYKTNEKVKSAVSQLKKGMYTTEDASNYVQAYLEEKQLNDISVSHISNGMPGALTLVLSEVLGIISKIENEKARQEMGFIFTLSLPVIYKYFSIMERYGFVSEYVIQQELFKILTTVLRDNERLFSITVDLIFSLTGRKQPEHIYAVLLNKYFNDSIINKDLEERLSLKIPGQTANYKDYKYVIY